MKAGHIKTKTKIIIVALEEFIRKNRIAGLKKFKGKVDLDIDIDPLRNRNSGPDPKTVPAGNNPGAEHDGSLGLP